MSVRTMTNTSTVNVYSRTRATDGMGGWTVTSDSVYANMPCRIRMLTGMERPVYGAERVEATYRLYCDAQNYTLTEDYIVVDGDSIRYDVLSVNNVDRDGRLAQVDMRELTT